MRPLKNRIDSIQYIRFNNRGKSLLRKGLNQFIDYFQSNICSFNENKYIIIFNKYNLS